MPLESKKGVTFIDCTLSDGIIQLYNSSSVQNVNEAATILLHGFLLESGFIPTEVPDKDKFQLMPKDWNVKGIFKIKYVHCCCPSFTCFITCVPLYTNISVHGNIYDTNCSESIALILNLSKYLKQKEDLSSICEVFCNLGELSRYFKDNFCLPFLNLLHETVGNKLFGFPGLYDELKVLILQLLPVESVVSMSAVNKNLYNVANSSLLWKYLFLRDFAKDGVFDVSTSTKTDWKEIYKKEYIKKKRKPEPRQYLFPRYHLPQIFNVGPDYDYNFGIDFDPPFPGPPFIPPLLQPRLPPPFFRRLI